MFQTEVAEKIKIHILCIHPPTHPSHAIYEIMWKNIVEPDRLQMTVWRMCISCWIPVATDTPSKHLILVFHCNNGCTNAPQCYVIRTLPVLS